MFARVIAVGSSLRESVNRPHVRLTVTHQILNIAVILRNQIFIFNRYAEATCSSGSTDVSFVECNCRHIILVSGMSYYLYTTEVGRCHCYLDRKQIHDWLYIDWEDFDWDWSRRRRIFIIICKLTSIRFRPLCFQPFLNRIWNRKYSSLIPNNQGAIIYKYYQMAVTRPWIKRNQGNISGLNIFSAVYKSSM